jgi:hypothetical protein
MVDVMEKPSPQLNTSRLHRPVDEMWWNTKAGARARPATALVYDDIEPVPPMFTIPHSAGAESEAERSTGKARFSPYIATLVLLTFAPVQAVLLTSSFSGDGKQALENALGFAAKGAAHAGAMLSIPTAEAAINPRQGSPASERVPSFNDREWSQTVDTFKRLLGEQKASQASVTRTENDRLLHNLETWVSARR